MNIWNLWNTNHDRVMLYLYPAVTLVILIATIVAAINPIYRRALIFMAASCALSIFCFLVTLFFHLYQDFHWSISVEVRRPIMQLHDLAELASAPLYLIGFLTLMYRIYSQSSELRSPNKALHPTPFGRG